MPHEIFDRLLEDLGVGAVKPGEESKRVDVPAHGGDQRIGIPPGSTRIDWKKGEVRHLGTDTVLTDEIPELETVGQVGKETTGSGQDQHVMRSVLAFADVGCTVKIAGSEIPLDPCSYFPISATPHTSLTLTTKLPAQIYIIGSARTRPFSELVSNAIHMDRVGPAFSGTADSWTDLTWQTETTADNGDISEADASHPALHIQNFSSRTFVVENTGANDLEFRIIGKVAHSGRMTNVDPANLPITVAAGATEIVTFNAEAWHVVKTQIRKLSGAAAGTSLACEYEMNGVSA